MSLPAAPKHVSAHPRKGSVTAPLNKDDMHSDIDRKLRFYGVLEAFRAGRMPDNAQIDETLRYLAANTPVDSPRLSPAGHKLVADIQHIIETARELVKEKNADELFQNFVWHTRAADLGAGAKSPKEGGQPQAREDAQAATHHLRTLLSLLLTNGEARKLVSDLSVVGRDLLARSAELIRPDEEALARAEEPGPDGEFRAAKKPADRAADTNRAGDTAQTADTSRAADTGGAGEARAPATATNGAPKGQKQERRQSFKQLWTGLRDRIPRDTDGRAKRFRDEYMPSERRDRFIFRGKKVILECQKHEDYKPSMTWLLDALAAHAAHGRKSAKDAKGVWDDPALRQATDELLALLARFANNNSTQPIRDAARALYDDARRDSDLRAWFKRFNAWARRVLLEPGYVLEKQCADDGVAVREAGRTFFDDKYKAHFDALFDTARDWSTGFTEDPLNTRFGSEWAQLTRDLVFGPDGRLAWKPELWADLRKVLVPQIVDKVGYIPIPRAEYTDDNLDLVVENLALSGRNMFPNIVAVEAHNFMQFSPYESIPDEGRHEVKITLGQMQADMRDVMFYFNKKTGVAKMKDSGVADIVLGGQGITATIHLKGAGPDSTSLFHVAAVHVKVSSLKFSIRDSKHDALYRVLRPLATALVKRQVQRAIRDALRTALELVDTMLVRVRSEESEGRRVGALQDMFKRHTEEAKEKSERRHSQFKVAAKRESLLLPEQGSPEGWVHKQQEKIAVAHEGHEWRSKAFAIVPQAA